MVQSLGLATTACPPPPPFPISSISNTCKGHIAYKIVKREGKKMKNGVKERKNKIKCK